MATSSNEWKKFSSGAIKTQNKQTKNKSEGLSGVFETEGLRDVLY